MAFERSIMKQLTLTPTQSQLVTSLVRASTSSQSVVERGSLILDSAQSGNISQVARKHGVGRATVRRWRERWQSWQAELDRLEAEYQAGTMSQMNYRRGIETLLSDTKRPGAPATFSEAQIQQIIAMATRHPQDEGVPVTHWSHEILAQTVMEKGIVPTISPAQIGRFLKGGHVTASPQSVLGTSHHRRLG
jgi:putative transposase